MEEYNNRELLSQFFFKFGGEILFAAAKIPEGVFMVKIIRENRRNLWLNDTYEDNSWDKTWIEAFAA
jgi:hypothetical protein